jgi:hypothetical protein
VNVDKPDYDDPEIEESWCNQQRDRVVAYLRSQQVEHGHVAPWPAWLLVPYVSIWVVESAIRPERIGWWVISGDLPTDYLPAENVKHPRDAMRAFGQLWLDVSRHMKQGIPHPGMRVGNAGNQSELAPLLENRAALLLEWSDDDSYWSEAFVPSPLGGEG